MCMFVKVEVANAKYKTVQFGARRIGDNVRKYVPVVNHSRASITFSLLISPDKPVNANVLRLANSGPITLSPSPLADCTNPKAKKFKEYTKDIEIIFTPKQRMKPFVEEVRYCVVSIIVLLSISCLAILIFTHCAIQILGFGLFTYLCLGRGNCGVMGVNS